MNKLVRFALVSLFPREGDLPGLAELGVDQKIADLRRDSTFLFWLGIVAAAFFFQISPILTVRRPYPAVWLSEEQLDTHAHKLASTPTYLIRQIVVLLKLVGGLFWGQSNEVRTFLTLPSYPADPGSRRTEKSVVPQLPAHRQPVPMLVQIGRREEERGRDGERDHKHAVDVESV